MKQSYQWLLLRHVEGMSALVKEVNPSNDLINEELVKTPVLVVIVE